MSWREQWRRQQQQRAQQQQDEAAEDLHESVEAWAARHRLSELTIAELLQVEYDWYAGEISYSLADDDDA